MFQGQHATGYIITWETGSWGEIRDWVSTVQWRLHQVNILMRVIYLF